MIDGQGDGARRGLEAARRLYELALDYADRGHAREADLLRAFQVEAAELAQEVGKLVVDDDDDEQLVLSADGRFTGRVLVDDPAPGWQPLASADDVADYYDPVDVFSDLADAIAEAFPGVAADLEEEAVPPSPAEESSEATAASRQGEGADRLAPVSPAGEESEMLRVLEDLHAAGVITDAQFAAQKAELDE